MSRCAVQTGRSVSLLLTPQSSDCLPPFHLQLLQATLPIALYLSAALFLSTRFKYCSRGLPTAPFPQILLLQGCSPQTRYVQLYALSVSGVYLFKVCKSNLSSIALWKTSSFVILSVHFVFDIPLQRHVSNAFTTLSSFFPRLHVSDPQRATLFVAVMNRNEEFLMKPSS